MIRNIWLVIAFVPCLYAGTVTKTSDTDFLSGTLTGLFVTGSGDSSYLKLNSKWTNMNNTSGPSPRNGSYYAFDSNRNKILIFGGYTGTTRLSDTWAYSLSTNTWESKASGTSSRYKGAMVYAPVADKMILFGGYDGAVYGKTWEYSPSGNGTWTDKLPVSSPSARFSHAMACSTDTSNDTIVLFGGTSDGGTPLGETWVYDVSGNTWTQKTPVSPPSNRFYHSMCYIGGGKYLLVGGFTGAAYNNESWIYDLNADTWTSKTAVPRISGRHTICYDSDNEKAVFFGGFDGVTYYSDTYVYDPVNNLWGTMSSSVFPPERYIHSMVYDSFNKKCILTGGSMSTTYFNDTWKYDFSISNTNSITWESSTIDTGVSATSVSWINASWSPSSQPNFTELKIQTASNNDNATWTYNGPDGTGSTYYTNYSGHALWTGNNGNRYIRIKAFLNSAKLDTPTLEDVTLTYNRPPTQPSLDSPVNTAVTNTTLVFTWNNSSDDDSDVITYRFLLDTTSDFTSGSVITYSGIAQGSGTTSYTVSSPLNYGDWYWKVLSYDGKNYSQDSSVRIIYVDNAPTVTVTAPNGGELWSGNKNIIWTYNDPDGGAYALSSFTVKLSQDNGVTYPITIASGVAPSGSPQTLVLDTRSYNNSVLCKIKIIGVDGKGLTAEDISNAVFSIKNAGAPVVSAPADMSVSTMTPVFSWENVSDDSTVSYRLLLSTTADFTSGSIITYSSIAQGSGTTSYTVSSPLTYGDWYWKVLATFDGESFSPDSLVRVIYADNAPTVTVTAPNGGELWSGNKNIIWTYNDPDGGAYALSSFTVKLSQDNGVTYPITIASGVAPSGSPQTLVLDTRSYNNSVLCKIKITGVDGKGITGEDISNAVFSIKNAASAPVVSAPEDLSVTSTTPVFSWGNVSDDSTVSYRLLLSTTADFTSGSIITYSSIAQGSGTTSYTVSSPLSYGDWYWKVLATFDGESFSPDSLVRVIYADNAPTVTVTAPNGGELWSGTQNITWTYNDPDGGAYALSAFTVKLSQDNGATYPVTLASGAAPSGSPQSLVLDTRSYNNSVLCKIKVIGVDGKGVTGEDLSNSVFAVNNANEAPVVTLTTFTGGGSFSNAQTISWTMTDVNGPDSHTYDIKLSSDGGISYSTTVVTGLTGLSYSWVTGNHVNGNQYRVKVIALDNGSPQLTGESFSGSNFTINNSNQAPKVFSLLTPLTGAVLSDDTPTLAWQNNGDPDSGLGDTITQFKVHYSEYHRL